MHAYMRAHALYLDAGIFSDTNKQHQCRNVSTMVDIRLLMQLYLSFHLWPSVAFLNIPLWIEREMTYRKMRKMTPRKANVNVCERMGVEAERR